MNNRRISPKPHEALALTEYSGKYFLQRPQERDQIFLLATIQL